MTEATQHKDRPAAEQVGVDGDRREALAKLGRFAGYTAPTMLVLLGSTKARATFSGSGSQTRRRRKRVWRKW